MNILNLKEMQQVSGGSFTVTIDLDTAASAQGINQSQVVADALKSLLTSSPFDIVAYLDAVNAAGITSSADIAEIDITQIQ